MVQRCRDTVRSNLFICTFPFGTGSIRAIYAASNNDLSSKHNKNHQPKTICSVLCVLFFLLSCLFCSPLGRHKAVTNGCPGKRHSATVSGIPQPINNRPRVTGFWHPLHKTLASLLGMTRRMRKVCGYTGPPVTCVEGRWQHQCGCVKWARVLQ